MDAQQILDALDVQEGLPVEAIRAAQADPQAVIPIFLQKIEAFTSSGHSQMESMALFFAFHLLGEWREKRAYRPLAELLRLPGDALEPALGDVKAATAHRVMAAVFDGDPGPLHEIIRTADADEYVRARMIHAIVMRTMSGDIDRAQTAGFLRDCYDLLEPKQNCYVWSGWLDAVSWLGLSELEPQAREAFARGSIHPGWLTIKDFELDLQHAIDHPGAAPLVPDHDDLTPFGETIAELEKWDGFKPRKPKSSIDAPRKPQLAHQFGIPTHNPFRDVGRNDPCPCGSGKKFKKCCWGSDPELLIQRIASLSAPR